MAIWWNTKKAVRQYNCRETDIRFKPESDSGLINEGFCPQMRQIKQNPSLRRDKGRKAQSKPA